MIRLLNNLIKPVTLTFTTDPCLTYKIVLVPISFLFQGILYKKSQVAVLNPIIKCY